MLRGLGFTSQGLSIAALNGLMGLHGQLPNIVLGLATGRAEVAMPRPCRSMNGHVRLCWNSPMPRFPLRHAQGERVGAQGEQAFASRGD